LAVADKLLSQKGFPLATSLVTNFCMYPEPRPEGSPVTEADHAADAFVKRRLGEVFPEAAWLSEETANGAARLDRVLAPALDETCAPARGTGAHPGLCASWARWRVSPVSTLRRL
jgi:hypothetical protein